MTKNGVHHFEEGRRIRQRLSAGAPTVKEAEVAMGVRRVATNGGSSLKKGKGRKSCLYCQKAKECCKHFPKGAHSAACHSRLDEYGAGDDDRAPPAAGEFAAPPGLALARPRRADPLPD